MKKEFALRMYSMVLYQLSGIQAGIQAGHATDEYGNIYDYPPEFRRWNKDHKTVIVLNGGPSSMLTESTKILKDLGVVVAEFSEIDIYDKVSAISFLIDERVYEDKLYPSFEKFLIEKAPDKYYWILDSTNPRFLKETLQTQCSDLYKEWVELIGGEANVFLKSWLKGFKLAG